MDDTAPDLTLIFLAPCGAPGPKTTTRIGARAVRWFATLAALLLHGPAALALDDAKTGAGQEIWRNSGCVDCHGPFADGERDDDDYPMGANLRTTRLDAAGIG